MATPTLASDLLPGVTDRQVFSLCHPDVTGPASVFPIQSLGSGAAAPGKAAQRDAPVLGLLAALLLPCITKLSYNGTTYKDDATHSSLRTCAVSMNRHILQ